MNRQQYEQYEQDFQDFMQREGLNCLTMDEGEQEPCFSWRPCDCCGRPEGGDRYDAGGYNPETEEVQDGYSICQDCLYYAEYGQLDDMTMMGIDND